MITALLVWGAGTVLFWLVLRLTDWSRSDVAAYALLWPLTGLAVGVAHLVIGVRMIAALVRGDVR